MKKSAATFLSLFIILCLIISCGSTNSNEATDDTKTSDSTRNEETENQQDERLSPADTAVLNLDDWKVSISYGSPAVRDREVWGGLVSYDKVWRTGANEATNFYTNREVEILGNKLPPGRYGFFTIPGKDSWTIIFNKVWNQWGAYEYNENEDVIRVMVKPQQLNTFSERLSFDLEADSDTKATLQFYWEKLQLSIPIELAN